MRAIKSELQSLQSFGRHCAIPGYVCNGLVNVAVIRNERLPYCLTFLHFPLILLDLLLLQLELALLELLTLRHAAELHQASVLL